MLAEPYRGDGSTRGRIDVAAPRPGSEGSNGGTLRIGNYGVESTTTVVRDADREDSGYVRAIAAEDGARVHQHEVAIANDPFAWGGDHSIQATPQRRRALRGRSDARLVTTT